MARHPRRETHFVSRIGWLRAAVLGANDGIVSTASLIAGVAASSAGRDTIVLTGVAALVAGALSMAAGEYVSVSSQADAEHADLEREAQELRDYPDAELEELTQIYVARGLDRNLAVQVATALMKRDALKAHARDELGLSERLEARPVQAAIASAVAFASGAIAPLIIVAVLPRPWILTGVITSALGLLALLGWLGAQGGGATPLKAILRVILWGAIALAVTSGIGHLFGAVA